ncbi:hypothetical protein MBANPS3_008729 [Mucor bainieri]
MIPRDTEKEFDESDALHYYSDHSKTKESLSSDRSEVMQGYISTFPFVTWTLVAAIGIASCLIHSQQDSLWQWTGDTTADAQSLQAKVVVSVFSAVIGGCVAAVLSKALVSVSFVIFRYRGANFPYLTTVLEGYTASRILTLVSGRRWASSMLIILILAISVATKQLAVVSMGVEYMTTNSTKISYTKNYTECTATIGASSFGIMGPTIVAQTFNAMLIPNNSYTSEYYDSSIPADLVGSSQFKRVLPYAEASCVQFNSSSSFGTAIPPSRGLLGELHHAISTCNDTKCKTVRAPKEITPFAEGAIGLPEYLQRLFEVFKPGTSKNNNIIITWLLGGDILKRYYANNENLPTISTPESVADRLAILGTVLTRTICDINYFEEKDDDKTTPITSNYISSSYYQYKILWKWPFYVLAGCILALWLLCMMAMWLAPESRVLSIDWLLNQYISRHKHGYLSGADLIPAHRGVIYQIYDDNANGDVGNIVISTTELHRLDKYDRVAQNRRYQ